MVTREANCNISKFTTFHLPVIADEFIEYDSINELIDIVKELKRDNRRYLHLGGGSNMLFSSRYDGAVLHCRCSEIRQLERNASHALIHVASGTVWDDFVKYTVANDLYGAVNLSYIPGEVGGAAVQNVGAYGSEAKDIVESVEVLDTVDMHPKKLPLDECCYGYRDSVFKHCPGRYIVTGVTFRLGVVPMYSLEYGPLKELADHPGLSLAMVRERIISIRQSKLPEPSELGSAGSFFKNPVVDRSKYEELEASYPGMPYYDLPDGTVKIPAGWLIETSGLKGNRIGGAEVYTKQCLVIVNTGNASAEDVLALKSFVQNTVRAKFGIDLLPEVNIVE
ncbi:MAG: UDP-N-acetylmuramate dehydrogenase [Lachnospiraceae bacterium]|nr:UDP-N-acetylmuramate dehydrogenase [Lachnospiraceae bacterium]